MAMYAQTIALLYTVWMTMGMLYDVGGRLSIAHLVQIVALGVNLERQQAFLEATLVHKDCKAT